MKRRLYFIFSFKGLVSSALLSLLCFSALLLVFFEDDSNISVTTASTVKENITVVIDAGHGGVDGGTQSADGTLEKDLNLEISFKLKSLLEFLGYNTVMLRENDELIYTEGCNSIREKKVSDQRNRLDIVRGQSNCIYVSIHQNYFTEEKYSGAQVFYSPNNELSKELAQNIQDSVVALIQNENNRKIKKSGSEIFMLDNIETPAVMVECGFMSNKKEAELLKNEDYQKKLVIAIAKGICEYALHSREEI